MQQLQARREIGKILDLKKQTIHRVLKQSCSTEYVHRAKKSDQK